MIGEKNISLRYIKYSGVIRARHTEKVANMCILYAQECCLHTYVETNFAKKYCDKNITIDRKRAAVDRMGGVLY